MNTTARSDRTQAKAHFKEYSVVVMAARKQHFSAMHFHGADQWNSSYGQKSFGICPPGGGGLLSDLSGLL